MALEIAKGERTNTKELHRLASKYNMDILDLSNIQLIEMNVEYSRRKYLELKARQEACRRKYLVTKGSVEEQKRKRIKDNSSTSIAPSERKIKGN